MPSVYDTLFNWARKKSTSFAEMRFAGSQPDLMDDDLIYRLKHWPDLSSLERTADIYRALSVMSNRPINRRWILQNSKLRTEQVDRLLSRLVQEGAVEVIDGSKFAAGGNSGA